MTAKSPAKRFFIWDAYWDTNRRQSFELEGKPGAVAALAQYWASVAQTLPPNANVLDIGCGHGAAAAALVASGSKANVTAIDEAAVDPMRYLPELAPVLSRISFKPRVQMEELPFPDQAFDAVISQYGLEFGPQPKTAVEIARVLKPGAFLAALVLPYNSEAVLEARLVLKQCRFVLAESKLFENALVMMQAYYQAPPEEAEAQIQGSLDQFRKQVEGAFARFNEAEITVLSVIVNALYQVIAARKTATLESQMFAIENARTHLAHFAARAQDTARAAMDINMTALKAALASAGMQVVDIRSMQANGYKGLVAYQLFARRAAPPPQQPPPAG